MANDTTYVLPVVSHTHEPAPPTHVHLIPVTGAIVSHCNPVAASARSVPRQPESGAASSVPPSCDAPG